MSQDNQRVIMVDIGDFGTILGQFQQFLTNFFTKFQPWRHLNTLKQHEKYVGISVLTIDNILQLLGMSQDDQKVITLNFGDFGAI